jgi:hypothetical protein
MVFVNCLLFCQEHPNLNNIARDVWRALPPLDRERTEWWRPSSARSALEVSGLESVDAFDLLSVESKTQFFADSKEELRRFEEETRLRMPRTMKGAIVVADSQLAARLNQRKSETMIVKTKPIVVVTVAPVVDAATEEKRKKAKGVKDERTACFVEWVQKCHSKLMVSVPLEVRARER